MDEGKVLATGCPAEIRRQTDTGTLESAFIALLPDGKRHGHQNGGPTQAGAATYGAEVAIEARGLTADSAISWPWTTSVSASTPARSFGFLGSNAAANRPP